MERREFLKKSLSLGLGAGVLFLPTGLRGGISQALAEGQWPDLVALRGAPPGTMFDKGIEALGGMGRFVKPGQTVVVKPNMSFDLAEEFAANTSPAVVEHVIRHCLNAGASRVYVTDHSIEHWERSLENSGIGAAIRAAGGIYVQAHEERFYRTVSLSGTILKSTQVHEILQESDVLITVPVLKHHGGTGVTIAMKNLMGCIWNRREYHRIGLHACIADFLHVKKPVLSVVDAHRVVVRHGPRGGSLDDVVMMNAQIISPDPVAADAAAALMLNREPSDIGHIRIAAESGFGEIDLARLKIERLVL